MPEETLAKSVRKIRSAEQWAEARRLYEEGLSLEGVGAKLGISYKTVWYHAWVEGWPVRSRGAPRDPRYQAAKAKQLQRKLAKEEERLAQELVLVKAEDLELLARKSLAADSARAKVAVSRRVIEILSRLEDSSVPVRSAAQALGALAPILRLIFGWGHEPGNQRMELARATAVRATSRARSNVKSYYDHWLEGTEPPECTGAVNLALIATSPEQLAEMAGRKADRDGHSRPSAAECNDLSVGHSAVAPKQPTAATHGCPSPKKEAPTGPVKEPVQRRRETDLQQAEKVNRGNPPSPTASKTAPKVPQNALKHSVEQTSMRESPPTPGSPAWHKLRVEELAHQRAEWRGWR